MIFFVLSFLVYETLSCNCGSLESKENVNSFPQFISSFNQSTNGMIFIPDINFLMGNSDDSAIKGDGEGPVRRVYLSSFWIDETEVSNEQFLEFTTKTGCLTEAEKFNWSFVFNPILHNEISVKGASWWKKVDGANWKHPEGPFSDIISLKENPVVHVSWNDAMAFCSWAGKRLPTEAEWECAARGGLEQKRFPFENELLSEGKHKMNIWQGKFPYENTKEDGFYGTAPVRSFPPNGYGLYNMCGNVWEWVTDFFTTRHFVPTNSRLENPKGPQKGSDRVQRGGSFLCHESYCYRYRVSSRTHNSPSSSTSNLGFRCAKNV